ncbi:hypothetical protein [Stieleria neptunia]|nr:hypothetical protein [Stieleria neptunia]
MFERTSPNINWSLANDSRHTDEVDTSQDSFPETDISKLGQRALVDVTYERRSFDDSVIVNLRTIGPSHDSDSRVEFPRDDMQFVIQGAKGAVVFESGIPWKDTGKKTIEGIPTYTARFLVHPHMKHGLILTESSEGLKFDTAVGIVTFHSLFEN